MSLKFRLAALTAGLFVAFIWALVLVTANILNERLEQLLADQQLAATAQLARQLDLKLKENIDGLNRAASGLPVELTPEKLQPLLAQRPLMHVAFSAGLLVTGLDGKALADYPALGRPGSHFGDQDWFRAVVAGGKPYIAKPVIDRTLARPVLTLAAPVIDAAGRVRAVLSGSIDLTASNFLDPVTDPALTGSSEFYVITPRDGLIIAATDTQRALTPTPARGRNPLYDRMADGYEGSGIAFSSAGIRKLYSGKRVPSADWIVIAALPTDIAFGPVWAMQKYLYACALLLTLGAVFAIGLMLRRMLAPLEEAASAIGSMTRRQRELAPLPVRRNDEIGTLVRNFNRLAVDRLEYEAALVESEQRFRLLVEGAPDAIFVQTRGCFAYVNAAALALFGAHDSAQLLGMPILERIHPDDRARIAERIRRVNEERRSNPAMEQTFLRLDGSAASVEVSAVPFQYGDDLGAIVFARDIGEKKRAAAELERYRVHLEEQVGTRTAQLAEAKQAAEAAARAKSDFLAVMSHEIRTPLGIIVGLGNVLRQKLHDPALKKRLERLCGTADHLSALVNDILDLSKIDAGHLALEEDDFCLGTLLDKVVNLVGELARDKGLALEVAADPALYDMSLRGDALRLAQVLINLVGNAIKFTERGSISLSATGLGETPDGLRLRFAVRDTGVGIAPADRERLFRSFEQADNSTTRKHGGTGLGLAISRKLVALMGASIQVDSELGIGSTFSFELTLKRGSTPRNVSGTATAPPSFGGARVLVVDDHPVNQEIIMDLLEALGCEVDIAGDGLEALACARAAAYDTILMDVRMPGMDGFAATRAIRALPGHRDTPILAVTANAFSEDRQRCLDAGMNGYISKPFTLLTLSAGLKQWLPLRAAAPAAPDEAVLRRALDGIPGLDAACLFRQTAPHPASYVALLRTYVETHEHEMERLREDLSVGDGDTARGRAHQLKGVSGLIGARRVAHLAAEIDAALRAGADADSVAPLVADCADALAHLAAAVRTIPAATAD